MKYIHLLVVAFVTLLSANAYAQGQPKFVDDGSIKIDGSSSDWADIANTFSDFGSKTTHTDLIDIKATKIGYSKTHFYFWMATNKKLGSWKPKKDISAFQIYFDVDAEQATGNSKLKVYDIASIMGYEYRIEVIIRKNSKVEAKLYSKSNGFNKEVSMWKSSESFKVSGNDLEFKIPLDLLNIEASGVRKSRFLFAEYSTSQKDHNYKGFNKVSYGLDFNKSASPAAASGEETSSESGGGFGIWQLMVITVWIVSILCSFAIVPKAGLSTGMALINIIPFFGQLAFLFILAFNQWPLHKDYNALENRIKELETQDEY